MTRERREQADLVNELLGAFRSEKYPWESNAEVIREIAKGIVQPAESQESGPLHIDVSPVTLSTGQKRYHERIERMRRAKDVEDLKAATAAVVQQWDDYNDAVAKTALAKAKRTPASKYTANLKKRSGEVDEQVEVLFGITKRLRREVFTKNHAG